MKTRSVSSYFLTESVASIRLQREIYMIELFIGAILGTVGSLAISHVYYKKSSCDLNMLILSLKCEIETLKNTSQEIEIASASIAADTRVIRQHSVIGTSDDSEFPYK